MNAQMKDELIRKYLRGEAKFCRVAIFSSLASTNTTAKQMAVDGAPDGTVIIAEHQSAGRGRMSRTFFSPDGTGLYMSLVIRRALSPKEGMRLTPTAAVAVAEAIEAVSGRAASIKWVNDVYLDAKKVCGILTEASISPQTNGSEYAVVGIGINVAPPQGGFPTEIADVATAMLDCQAQAQGMREHLAAEILNRLMAYLDTLSSPAILAQYRRRALFLGEKVFVRRMEEQGREAKALDIDEDFRLCVRYEDGTKEALHSGEVSVKRTK